MPGSEAVSAHASATSAIADVGSSTADRLHRLAVQPVNTTVILHTLLSRKIWDWADVKAQWDEALRWFGTNCLNTESYWRCYWMDRNVAQRTPTYFQSTRNFSVPPYSKVTMDSTRLEWPNNREVDPYLSRNDTDLEIASQLSHQLSHEGESSLLATTGVRMVHPGGLPIWACGLLGGAWGCTPDSVRKGLCVQYAIDKTPNSLKSMGGFVGNSLTTWEVPLSDVSQGGGPGYDRFCAYVPKVPELTPESAGLPEPGIFTSPPGRYFHTLEYVAQERVLVLFGGTNDTAGGAASVRVEAARRG